MDTVYRHSDECGRYVCMYRGRGEVEDRNMIMSSIRCAEEEDFTHRNVTVEFRPLLIRFPPARMIFKNCNRIDKCAVREFSFPE